MKRNAALIELSIVLVIIGLIIGGVLVGQDLIKQRSCSAVSEVNEVKIKIIYLKTASANCPVVTKCGLFMERIAASSSACNGGVMAK